MIEIEFICPPELFGKIPEPAPAAKFMPDWFRNLPRDMGIPDADGLPRAEGRPRGRISSRERCLSAASPVGDPLPHHQASHLLAHGPQGGNSISCASITEHAYFASEVEEEAEETVRDAQGGESSACASIHTSFAGLAAFDASFSS